MGAGGEGPWFIVPRDCWRSEEVLLPAVESHHALKVLRIQPPDIITVSDGAGSVARCAVERVEDGQVVATVLESVEGRPLRPALVVYQGAAKSGKNDDVIERLAELGVAETWVYASARSVVRWDQAKSTRLAERWSSIATGAAKQSRNPFVMETGAPLSWVELVRRIAREPDAVVLWEGASLPLRVALGAPSDRIALVVGPEGGLERREAEELADAGAQLVSLGPRVLRTENAAVAAAAALQYHFGLLG